MTTPKQIEAFSRKFLLPRLPGWAARGPWLLVTPVGQVRRGVLINRWRWDKSRFTLDTFATPLYVPQTDERMAFGARLTSDWSVPRGEEASAADEALRLIRRKGMRWLAKHADPPGLAATFHPKGTEPQHEAALYGLIWAGKTGRALNAVFEPLQRELDAMRDDEDYGRGNRKSWFNQMHARVKTMMDLSNDPKAARAQLDKWTAQSVRALKLKPFE